jgi:hypothetical protein
MHEFFTLVGTGINNTFTWVVDIINANKVAAGLVALAFGSQMRDKLPSPFDRIELCNWFYEWLHDGVKTLISLKSAPRDRTVSFTQQGIQGVKSTVVIGGENTTDMPPVTNGQPEKEDKPAQ